MSVFALCVLGQACTAYAKTAFVLPLPCQSCEEKERQEECKQRRMVQPSNFPVFFRAFCTVKLCQRNGDEGGDARDRLYSSCCSCCFLWFSTISSVSRAHSSFDDSSQRGQYRSVEFDMQQGTHTTLITLATFPIPSFHPSDPEPSFLFHPSCFLPLVVMSLTSNLCL